MRYVLIILLALTSSGCDLDSLFPDADEQFGRQNFNSAIALIELHKVRTGSYPKNLKELEYLGDWDAIWLASVRYEPTATGYDLFVTRGFAGEPELTYPVAFKNGLGLEKSNISWK